MIIDNRETINTEGLLALANEAGFSHTAPLTMDSLVVRDDVRAMCSADLCKQYGKSWSCPPATGSLESAERRIAGYNAGIIVQTTDGTRGSFDMDSIRAIGKRHKKCFDDFVRQVRVFYPDCMPMGAGTCTICHKCTYPDRPCRHPGRMYPSMEAYGILVSDVCINSGLRYNYGANTMTFTSCILIKG